MRSFREQGLLFPRRLRSGPHKGELVWGPLLHHRALRVVKNPRYAGAFTYGRSRGHRTAGGPERRSSLPREQWHTLILDAHPGYITWAEHEENLRRLHENGQAYGADRRKSPPREGPALLQGLAICGRCGDWSPTTPASGTVSRTHGRHASTSSTAPSASCWWRRSPR